MRYALIRSVDIDLFQDEISGMLNQYPNTAKLYGNPFAILDPLSNKLLWCQALTYDEGEPPIAQIITFDKNDDKEYVPVSDKDKIMRGITGFFTLCDSCSRGFRGD